MSALSQALQEYADELEFDTPGSGLTYLKTLRDNALAQIMNGEGASIISSTVNGQTFSQQINVSADKMFEETSAAIREFKDMFVRFTGARFSNIPL